MKIKFKYISLLALALTFTLHIGGCSSKKVNENDPKEMFEDAESDIKNDRYLLALDKLRVVKNKFAYTSYGALAQLKVADVYFLQESYPEAASSYETFVELFPKHEKAAYALFRAGESQFLDIPSNTARDLKSAESTIQTFELYSKKYPTGEHLQKAMEMKQLAYDRLAEKELSIAEFYIKRKKFDSARLRINKILDNFSTSSSAEKAKELLKSL
jgi:outer membrane protein assembly factor BamD